MSKKLALMQPYFFPYLGYYTIMKHVDYYVYFDTAQYIKGGWINRNRILKPDGVDWQYITVPVKKHIAETQIKNVQADLNLSSIRRILNQLSHYRKKAPYYDAVINIVKNTLQLDKTISEVNIYADKLVCDYLGIKEPKYILSQGEIDYIEADSADEWGLNVCQAFPDVSEYRNAPGGKSFFNADKYARHGIEIRFVENNLRTYRQKVFGKFVSGLSILDVMMFNSPDEINDMLDDFVFV
ncbi:MAG: WbqC family protein [Selenomonadaceae bacterium]|nr:WbqC family protein [Selenomonadaceae bacterium]